MKIALRAIGGDEWVGGVHYIINLVRALKSMPPEEQPELMLISSSGTLALTPDEERLFAEILGEMWTAPRESGGRVLRDDSRLHLVGRLLRRILRNPRNPYASLGASLQNEGAEIIFPCVTSMGAGFPLPWLAWAPDFQHRHLPALFSAAAAGSRDRIFAALGRDAPMAITSSQDALDDFNRFYPGHPEKLRVLRFHTVPPPEWFLLDPATVVEAYGLPDKYLLIPNQFFSHKNHRAAFEALAHLKASGIRVDLVCTGNTRDSRWPGYFDELTTYLSEAGLADQVHILGLIPRLEQVQLIRAASAILQPSLFEGWSTVVEDSRALGKTLFLSDLSVHREQDPPVAIFFDPHSPESLATAIAQHWPELPGGHVPAEESAALERQKILVEEYARCFIGIATEAVSIGAKSR